MQDRSICNSSSITNSQGSAASQQQMGQQFLKLNSSGLSIEVLLHSFGYAYGVRDAKYRQQIDAK